MSFNRGGISLCFLSSGCQLEFSCLEVKYDIFSYIDEGIWTWLSTLSRTGFVTEVCSYITFPRQIANPLVSADAKADQLTM